jgi:hypothetical protein
MSPLGQQELAQNQQSPGASPGPGQVGSGGNQAQATPQNPKKINCQASSAESGLAKSLGFGSNANDVAAAAAKLAAPQYSASIDRALGPLGFVLTALGEAAQVTNDIANGMRPDVALVGADARLASPIIGGAVGAALGTEGGPPGAVGGGVLGTVAGLFAAPTLGRLAEADYLRAIGCR